MTVAERGAPLGALTRLIDLYYLHRVDPESPIEDTVGGMAELVAQGNSATSAVRSFGGDHPPGELQC